MSSNVQVEIVVNQNVKSKVNKLLNLWNPYSNKRDMIPSILRHNLTSLFNERFLQLALVCKDLEVINIKK